MINFNPITNESGECIVVGRAASAIYLVLSELSKKDKFVIVPANICYAAIFPILSAGLKPLFCDIDKYSGNVTVESIRNVINEENIVAAIIPHMYGNPVKDIIEIKKLLSNNGIIMIEDCASFMFNEIRKNSYGTIGDYIIYSTGYSKTIDNGIGGFLFSSRYSLIDIENKERLLPLYNEQIEKETQLFSKMYRIIRNYGENLKLTEEFFQILKNSFKDNFVFRIDEMKKQNILDSVSELSNIIEKRRKNYQIYYKELISNYIIYNYEEDAIPWRFNLIIESDDREKLIEYCLINNLPISDWYPVVANMFNDKKIYKNAKWHEKHIINFPLLLSEEQIYNICNKLNQYKGGKNEK